MRRVVWIAFGVCGALTGCGSDGPSEQATSDGVNASATSDGGSDTGTGAAASTGSSGEAGGEGGGTCEIPESGGYADCVNASASACENEEAGCLVNSLSDPSWGVCFLDCQEDCDCWDAPDTGTAVPRCAAALSMGGRACILDCADDRSCPDGMRCLGINGATRACVYDLGGLVGTTSGGDDSTGGDGTTGDSTSGSDTSTGDESTGSSSGDSSSSGTDSGSGTTTMGA